jgi:protein involved in sex pheromone biosynthesis
LNYGICAYLKNSENNDCNLFWVSSHQRLRKFSQDEDEQAIKDFNNGMKKYFVNFQNCGSNTRYIDTFDFTKKLVSDLPKEAEGATTDGIHWGLSVNLIKAVEIITDLIKD